MEGQGAYGEDEDGGGEEDETDEPVFMMVRTFCAVDPQEDCDANGKEKDKYAHEAPCGTCAAARQHGADPANGKESCEEESDRDGEDGLDD